MTSYVRWLWVLWIGLGGIALSLALGFTSFFDTILSSQTLTPLLLNKEIVFGMTLVISFAVVGVAQHFLTKIMGQTATHHIQIK